MSKQEIECLRAEIMALKTEVSDLKDIVSGLYMMMVEEDEVEGSPIQTGRYLN